MDDAACKDLAPRRSEAKRDADGEIIEFRDSFFPGRGESFTAAQIICMSCPVRRACQGYDARTGNEYGVWAGNLKRRKTTTTHDSPDEED